MRNKSTGLRWMFFALLAISLTACTTQAKVTPNATVAFTPTSDTYTDPFAYCAAAGTVDSPDARYTGPKITDEIVKGYLKGAGIPYDIAYKELYQQMTIWRCMDHKLYACNFGANLPCDSKANTDKTPTQEMQDFCKANSNSDFIPMSVTGHSTIYSWRCVNDTAELLDQIDTVDAAGYLARIWYEVVR
jgi:hypothetical protein